MPSFTALPGFRDFLPPDLAVRNYIFNTWRETARRYGYEEYDGPPLEPLELYIEKSGEEIVRQLYNFEDKGGRQVALRPEMTPTFARMVGARAGGLRKPIRWFSIPQLFRYERMQRGRLREHYQWNVDMVGESHVAADAEVVVVALDSLRMLGLTEQDVVARVNDRRLLEKLLLASGVPADALVPVYNVIDKLGRDTPEESTRRLEKEAGLDAKTIEKIFSLFNYPNLDAISEAYVHDEAVQEAVARMRDYLASVGELGFADYVQFDPTIVRGLAYYTGFVFEIFDRKGEFRAICGGGRYDALLRTVSEVDLPALGFGMGDVVLTELLRDRNLLPEKFSQIDFYVVTISEQEQPLQRRIAHALREKGYAVSHGFGKTGVGKQFKDADARGARAAIVLGPSEVAEGVVIVRDMSTGTEQRIPLERALAGELGVRE